MATYTFTPATDKQYSFANSILRDRRTGGYQSDKVRALVESHKCSKWEMSKLINDMLEWRDILNYTNSLAAEEVCDEFGAREDKLVAFIEKSIAERETA